MPIVSKYSNEQVETIINELLDVIAKHDTKTDLALMCLGNAVSNVIRNNIAEPNRQAIVKSFTQALESSVK